MEVGPSKPYFCLTAAISVRPKITKKPANPPNVLGSPPAAFGVKNPVNPTESDTKARTMTAAQAIKPRTGFMERSDLPTLCAEL